MNGGRRFARRDFLRFGVAGVASATALAPSMKPAMRVRANDASPSIHPQTGPAEPIQITIPGLRADGPVPALHVSSGSVHQGGTVRILVAGAATATANVLGRSLVFDSSAEGAVAYAGISVSDSPGETLLTVNAVDLTIGPVQMERTLTILPTDWTVDYIWLPPGTGGGIDDPDYPRRVQEEIELLAATYALIGPRRWEEPWKAPVEAPVSGYFGEQRSFNGGPVSGHHGGTDFGVEAGAPVRSCNAGRVVVARELATRGNAVIIDHGTGILSLYGHLSAIHVSAGETVGKGQVIGLVGSTGLSTGPHLHWELAVRGILVDGLRWLDGSQGF